MYNENMRIVVRSNHNVVFSCNYHVVWGCTPQLWSRSGGRVDQVPGGCSAHVGQALPEAVPLAGAVNRSECGD